MSGDFYKEKGMKVNKIITKRMLGFTLIEVMIALTILAIAMLSFVPMVISTIRANAFGSQMTRATQLCQDKLEEIRRMPFDHDDITSGVYPSTAGYPMDGTEEVFNTIYKRNYEVSLPADPDPDTKLITVTVDWQTGGRPVQNTTYVTIKVNY